MQIELRDLAEKIGAEIANPPEGELSICGLASLRDATASDLAFFHDDRYLGDLKATGAAAVLVASDSSPEITDLPQLRVTSPSLAFDLAAKEILERRYSPPSAGVHPSACIDPGVEFDPEKVAIGPNAVIGEGSTVGEGCEIGAGVVIGRGVEIGACCKIYPNVTLYDRTLLGERVILHSGCVLGADGFGFETSLGEHKKIEHFGYVQVDDDVEVGANSTIDRGRFGRTWIGEGTKLDNLVQIGHNVTVGKKCIFVADTAIAGSTQIGDYVTVAAQVGMGGQLEIGSYSVFAARSGVTKSVPGGTPEKPAYYAGFPTGPASRVRKEMVAPRKIPEILRRLKALERRLED